MRVLSRAWQMLLKGITEVEESGRPLAAAEMVLVRMAYAADLPTPDEVIRSLDGNGSAPAPRTGNGGGASAVSSMSPPTPAQRFEGSRGEAPRGAPRAALAQAVGDPATAAEQQAAAPALVIDSFAGLIALAAQKRDLSVKTALERDVRLVRCEDGRLDIALEPSAAKALVNDLSRKLLQWTGRRWVVVVSAEPAQPTVKSQLDARQAELKTGVRADPLVQAVLAKFPGAEIVNVRAPDQPAPLPADEIGDVSLDDMTQDGTTQGDIAPEPPPADEGSYGAQWRDGAPEDE
jgi:DNA polymerase-3 subunit gamma/tau